ncbi:carboxypeptidase Q-like [Ochlerotatus camptorhynchus]|uniref:carboxypeptidase Q-like n=1 Tax=Ochlerotatus camptorhynchus TaxID=644619 RepID=UPI0031DE8492
MLKSIIFTLCLVGRITAVPLKDAQPCQISEGLLYEIRSYQPIVHKIMNEIVNGRFAGQTWQSLAELTDTFGPRMTGSQQLEDAIDYAVKEMIQDGLENVHTEDVPVPHWVRGYERAQLVEPIHLELPILGLGTSVGTPYGGISAEVIVVQSFAELDELPNELIEGKIVVFVPQWVSYGETGTYRRLGASAAAKKGAVASLIRSVTQFSIGSIHTGVQEYEEGVRKIPTASITVEHAEMLLRKYHRGEKLKIHLEMHDENLGMFMSRNTIAELQGLVYRNSSVVVVSGHLDSWDVGVGAMDDGGGVMISWKALTYLKALGLRPRRTIRAVLFTGEEQGVWGGRQYFENHKAQGEEEFNFFFESDSGTFNPLGYGFAGNDEAKCIFQEIVKLLAPLNATEVSSSSSAGPDVTDWSAAGYPGAGLLNANDRYFWFHHTAGDSMLVEDPANLDRCAAIWAATAYVVADLSIAMPKTILHN